MVIDVHNHFMPQRIAAKLGAVAGKQVIVVENGVPKLTLLDRMFVPEKRLADMDKAGISLQLISSGAGWNVSMEACRSLNDDLSRLQKQYPGKFLCMAHVPLGSASEGGHAIEELHRAVDELKLKGVSITAQPFGVPLDDKNLWPFFREAEKMGAPIAVHPSHQIKGFAALEKFDLQRSLGREIDLMTGICRMIQGGLLDYCPNLKVIFSHFGGSISALLERLASTVDFDRVKWQQTYSSHEFRAYIKRLYFDTSGYVGGMVAFRLACEVLGPSRLLFGTDYPKDFIEGEHMGDYIRQIKNCLSQEDFEKVMYKNASDLFGLTAGV